MPLPEKPRSREVGKSVSPAALPETEALAVTSDRTSRAGLNRGFPCGAIRKQALGVTQRIFSLRGTGNLPEPQTRRGSEGTGV